VKNALVLNPRSLWIAVIDIGATIWLVWYLLGKHHHSALLGAMIVGWLIVVPIVTIPEINRIRRERRLMTSQSEPPNGPRAHKES
jgi:hypothetical protein